MTSIDKYGPKALIDAGLDHFVDLIHELTLHLAALTYAMCVQDQEEGMVSRAVVELYRKLSIDEVSEVQLAILAQCAMAAEKNANNSLQN